MKNKSPYGKLNKQDQHEKRIDIIIQDTNLIIDFGDFLSWIGFTKEDAIRFAEKIIKAANTIKKH
jgi:hypothetical protein